MNRSQEVVIFENQFLMCLLSEMPNRPVSPCTRSPLIAPRKTHRTHRMGRHPDALKRQEDSTGETFNTARGRCPTRETPERGAREEVSRRSRRGPRHAPGASGIKRVSTGNERFSKIACSGWVPQVFRGIHRGRREGFVNRRSVKHNLFTLRP